MANDKAIDNRGFDGIESETSGSHDPNSDNPTFNVPATSDSTTNDPIRHDAMPDDGDFDDEEMTALFASFDKVSASDSLKQDTLTAILALADVPDSTSSTSRKPASFKQKWRAFRIMALAACLALALSGGAAYAIPSSQVMVSQDGSSIELGVNIFGITVDAKSDDETGQAVIDEADLKNVPYEESLNRAFDSFEKRNPGKPFEIDVKSGAFGQHDRLESESTRFMEAHPATAEPAPGMNAAPQPEQQPGAQPAGQPGEQPGGQPHGQPASQPNEHSYGQPTAQPGEQPDAQPGSKSDESESQPSPGNEAGSALAPNAPGQQQTADPSAVGAQGQPTSQNASKIATQSDMQTSYIADDQIGPAPDNAASWASAVSSTQVETRQSPAQDETASSAEPAIANPNSETPPTAANQSNTASRSAAAENPISSSVQNAGPSPSAVPGSQPSGR